jgi:ABC-2 type transport system ATP-binding protein
MQLEMRNIEKSFGPKEVLKGVSLEAQGGRALGLLGRNGAGKTTSIRIIMNVFPPNAGDILFDGKPIDYNQVQFGYLPEERGLYAKQKIMDQLLYFAQLKGMSRKAAQESIAYWLDRLAMTDYKDQKLETLSKGNQQKIQLITALAHNPQVLILDEPFTGLDPVNARLLEDVVREEIQKGKIVLFSSHQMAYVETFCDHIAILNGGKIVLQGDLESIKRSYPRNRLIVKSPERAKILVDLDKRYEISQDKDRLLISLPTEDAKAGVMEALARNYNIDAISILEPSLNDIFVQYAGDPPAEDKTREEALA